MRLIPGMVVLGIGVGLFYSSVTTRRHRARPVAGSLAGGIVYMCQIAGGVVGLGLNTAIVATASSLPDGIRHAFLVDALLAVGGVVISVLFVGGRIDKDTLDSLLHRHRAHG